MLTTEIIAHLKDSGLGEVNGQRIRSSGVAKLRDAGVIISSAVKGYKIPKHERTLMTSLSERQASSFLCWNALKRPARFIS